MTAHVFGLTVGELHCLLPLWETLVSRPKFLPNSCFYPRDPEHARACVCPFRVESMFLSPRGLLKGSPAGLHSQILQELLFLVWVP